jgi:tripartite-type tricarboxylate transporter receptor subunit TctC
MEGRAMKLPRREFLHLAAGAAALPAVSPVVWAQAYPARPVRIIVGYAPGGVTSVLARLMSHWLSERLGQQFIVENRPGAATNIATEAVVRAPGDGHSLLLASGANAINAALYEKLNFNFIRDIAPIAGITRVPLVMVVHTSVPAKTLPEFIAYAKANSGKISMASTGSGSAPHAFGELFKMMADVNIVHVPYRGGAPAITDLLAGQVQVFFGTPFTLVEHIRTGTLRALALTSASRLEVLPDVPTIGDFVPGYEATDWFGLVARKATSAEIIDKLNMEINAGLADPKLKARLTDLGGTVLALSPAEFGKLIADETDKWAKVVKFAGIKAE